MNSREVFACYSIAAAAVAAHRWQRTRRQRVRGYIVIHELVHGFYTVCVQTGQWRAVWGGVGTEDKRRMTTNDIYIYFFFPSTKLKNPLFPLGGRRPRFCPKRLLIASFMSADRTVQRLTLGVYMELSLGQKPFCTRLICQSSTGRRWTNDARLLNGKALFGKHPSRRVIVPVRRSGAENEIKKQPRTFNRRTDDLIPFYVCIGKRAFG